MTLLQMSYILEIDRCGSINRAAQNLFVSQSALSSAIAEVEKELGITIFHRSNRGVALTEDGRELLNQIIPIVERSRKITRYYSERRAENRVTLSIDAQRYPFCAKASCICGRNHASRSASRRWRWPLSSSRWPSSRAIWA